MDQISAQLIRYSQIVTGERVVIAALVIALIAMTLYRENRKSSKWLFTTIVVGVVYLIGDSESYSYAAGADIPYEAACAFYFISYTFGYLLLIPFSQYAKCYLEEKTTVNQWLFRVPVITELVVICIAAVAIFSGSVFGNVDGRLAITGGEPVITQMLAIATIIYIFVASMTKIKQVGIKASLLLGLFGLVPAVMMYVAYDLMPITVGLSVLVVDVLLQSDISADKDRRNKEQASQIEEINALNTQLESNQAELEASVAEQEAQIEEINALNVQLEESERKAEAANQAKSTFLFNMSHDIRTPMNAIIGYANLMKRNPDNLEKWPDYLDKILSSSDFLLGLINNVLEMARIESGKTVLDENVYAVDDFVDQIYSVFADEMGKKDLKFTKSVEVEHHYLYADSVKLREIYLNIISNAQKYTMPGGSVNIAIKELPSEVEDHVLIQMAISDTGIGMSEEFLPHIFEEFTRETNSTGNKIQGTGLGMPIVKKLVDLMGGTIEVQSEIGQGSTFTVTTPHKIAEKPSEEVETESADFSNFAGKRILLAEDNDLNAEIAMEILSEYGFRIERAEDGVVCIDMLTRAKAGYYNLILMDIQMPNLDGYGATRTIRQMSDLEKADIPIIAMTANAFDEDKRNALEAGMDGHVAKPINIGELIRTLAGTIG